MKGNIILFCLVFWPMAGAFLSYLIGKKNKKGRDLFADFVVVLECLIMVVLLVHVLRNSGTIQFAWEGFCLLGIHLELDGFRVLYGLIAAFMWMMTTIFSREYFRHHHNRNRYYLFTLLTFGATMGVFLSADLYTTFIFFEIMSLTSYVWVAQEENRAALRAAGTYLGVAVIGGLVMLMGLFLLYDAAGTLALSQLGKAVPQAVLTGRLSLAKQYLIGGLLVFGFGAKAGMFPLHIWLPAAHPVAPAPASALLSGILTKSGVFGILAVTCNIFRYQPYWGYVIVILGTITMFLGALLAIFSVDLKRVLACSSMSQIGFILIGAGMISLLGDEAALASRGTLLHMVNHSLIKLDLFMVAGVIYMNVHKLNLNEIRGFGRKKPLLKAAFLMGALGIGGIPLWNGYVSKTLLHESIVEYTHLFRELPAANLAGTYSYWKGIEWIFLISGGMTVAYMLKLFIAVFVEENTDPAIQEEFDRN
ncbi:MAG: sodium:proton antiporter, partial [Eubacterium sp.]|nr:sodium:proton antiporter [Eubacterium sp.]